MMPTSDLIKTLRAHAQGLDFPIRFLIEDACDRLKRKTRDNELLSQRIASIIQKLKKTEPCKYCDGSETRFRNLSDYISFDYIEFENGKAFLVDADGDTIKIVACPICGRRLDIGGADHEA